MKSSILSAALVAALVVPFSASAAPVDLSGWTSEGQGNWNVQPGNDTVLQTSNGYPTVFFESGSNARGTQLSGDITVKTTGDDDFVGFVLGYQAGEITSSSTDFWLIDWKQGNQSVNGHYAGKGLALSHVTNASKSNTHSDFWSHTGGVREVARGSSLGSTGWADLTEYSFDLVFTAHLLEVYVNDALEISVTSAQAGVSEFTDGAMGFYNYSQSHVEYASITSEQANVSEPGSVALLGLGLLGLGLARRKSKAQYHFR